MNTESEETQFLADTIQGRSRWWDIPAAILLLVAMFTAASRLEATQWSKGLSIVPYVAIFGTIAGIALGQSRFSAKIAGLFGFIYGLYIVGWQLGTLTNTALPWKEKILELTNRANHVLAQMANRQSVNDSILFIALMAILFWVLSLVAGYTLIRHGNAWWAILPRWTHIEAGVYARLRSRWVSIGLVGITAIFPGLPFRRWYSSASSRVILAIQPPVEVQTF